MNVIQAKNPSLTDLQLEEGPREPVAKVKLGFMEEYTPRRQAPVQVVAAPHKPVQVDETRNEAGGQSYSLNTIFGD